MRGISLGRCGRSDAVTGEYYRQFRSFSSYLGQYLVRAPFGGPGIWFVHSGVAPLTEALFFLLGGVSPSDEPQYPGWKRGRLECGEVGPRPGLAE